MATWNRSNVVDLLSQYCNEPVKTDKLTGPNHLDITLNFPNQFPPLVSLEYFVCTYICISSTPHNPNANVNLCCVVPRMEDTLIGVHFYSTLPTLIFSMVS